MATKKVSYSEPRSYFNADMKKAERAWEKEQKAKNAQSAPKKKEK